MNLQKWAEKEAKQRGISEKKVLQDLAQCSGVSYMTLGPAANGMRLGLYEKAKAVSKATNWEVTIPELCDPEITPEVQQQFAALMQVCRG